MNCPKHTGANFNIFYWVSHYIVHQIGFIVIKTLESALQKYTIKIQHNHLSVKTKEIYGILQSD
jgi:hypothetical protein